VISLETTEVVAHATLSLPQPNRPLPHRDACGQ